jgi:hypothetical protein
MASLSAMIAIRPQPFVEAARPDVGNDLFSLELNLVLLFPGKESEHLAECLFLDSVRKVPKVRQSWGRFLQSFQFHLLRIGKMKNRWPRIAAATIPSLNESSIAAVRVRRATSRFNEAESPPQSL